MSTTMRQRPSSRTSGTTALRAPSSERTVTVAVSPSMASRIALALSRKGKLRRKRPRTSISHGGSSRPPSEAATCARCTSPRRDDALSNA